MTTGSVRRAGQLLQHGQRLEYGEPANLVPADIAETFLPVEDLRGARGGEMNEADRLLRRPAARAGNAGDGDGEIGARLRARTLRHGLGGLGADRAVRRERGGRNSQKELFGLVGIGDEAAIDHVRGAGNLRERRRHQAAGAGLRRRHLPPARAAEVEHARGGGVHRLVDHAALHGSRIVAVAMATIPSRRPVKPSVSLVVALIATRSRAMPATPAMRARMASRCGPTRGASHTMVTSRWAIMPARARTRSQ